MEGSNGKILELALPESRVLVTAFKFNYSMRCCLCAVVWLLLHPLRHPCLLSCELRPHSRAGQPAAAPTCSTTTAQAFAGKMTKAQAAFKRARSIPMVPHSLAFIAILLWMTPSSRNNVQTSYDTDRETMVRGALGDPKGICCTLRPSCRNMVLNAIRRRQRGLSSAAKLLIKQLSRERL